MNDSGSKEGPFLGGCALVSFVAGQFMVHQPA